ncbi:Pseudaminic acid synthase [compost metagenome]
MKAGDVFDTKNLRAIRPGMGMAPKYYNQIIGKIANKDISKGTPVSWDLLI